MEEDIVEKVVAEKHIESHEDKAELFTSLTLVVLIIAISIYWLKKDDHFKYALYSILFLDLMIVLAGINVGRSGGELVYTHGALNNRTISNQNNFEFDDHKKYNDD